MPWQPDEADRHFKDLDDKGRRQWANVANASLSACLKDGGDQKECEAKAVRQANGVVGKSLDSIAKIDEDKRRVFGWTSISILTDGNQMEDLQGDMIDPDQLEDAVYDFTKNCRLSGENHEGEATGEMIEGMLFTPEKTFAMFKRLLGENLAKEVAEKVGVRAFHGFEYAPAAFAKVKSGEYRMYSIQGKAERVPA